MYKETETDFDAIVRKTGNSYVITVPKEVLTKLNLSSNSGLSVHIKKWAK
jgi:antitoxin component of MazEF toxin-antitoxin module